MLVGELGEAELRARPQHQLLREARRVHGSQRARIDEVGDEVAVRHRVDAVAERARETELLRDGRGIDVIGNARERTGAERRHGRALPRLGDARAVAAQRLDVREQVVREGDRLRALQVGIARQHRVDFGFGASHERGRERLDRGVELVQQLDDQQAKVERDLVVAAARRMQLAAGGADALGERALDRGVDVLRVGGPDVRPGLDLCGDVPKGGGDLFRLFTTDDLLASEHARVRDAAAHIVQRDALVELERRREIADARVEGSREPPRPQRLRRG